MIAQFGFEMHSRHVGFVGCSYAGSNVCERLAVTAHPRWHRLAAVQLLPWSLIPTVLVPFYLITHGIIFSQLLARRPNARAASHTVSAIA